MENILKRLKILRVILWSHFLFLMGREVYREYYYREVQIKFLVIALVSAFILQAVNDFIIEVKNEINNKN
jgi:hypothetical protein